MTARKKTFGNNLIQGINEALEYTKGNKKNAITHEIRIPENINVDLACDSRERANHRE